MNAKLASVILIEVVLLLTVSHGQQPSSIADPDSERILDKAAQAEGSDGVLDSLRTLRLTGTIYAGSSVQVGDVESIVKFPDKFRDTFLNTDGRSLRYGFDGTHAWSRLSGQGMTGLPRIQLLLPAAQWRSRYTEARFVGQRKIGERQAYIVRAIVHGQTAAADYYYDADNYVLFQVDTADGNLAVSYHLSRFHYVEGLNIPREWSWGQNRTVISRVKLNVDIDDKQFAK